ncbi:MAG: hypothetical protein JW727_03370 [Candidatus Aenigmarchaeota archaeon]|nr:hypothetical protein [Candidatus Aenigmarchaeota archaeon]
MGEIIDATYKKASQTMETADAFMGKHSSGLAKAARTLGRHPGYAAMGVLLAYLGGHHDAAAAALLTGTAIGVAMNKETEKAYSKVQEGYSALKS